ncbi:MAG: beta-ketoacyl-[acyl-carrier-protein] synthase II [Spirochaetaceae bacterium]|nr:MAG: beta-ketoacyl-[acyl-carrier-protein] synthase II [Spirochaetaceae bacterium]
MEKRIVITGLGTINPLGNSVDESWEAVKHGKSGIARIDHFDTSMISCRIAGMVKDLDVDSYIDSKEARKLDKFAVFGIIASIQAMKDAGFTNGDIDPVRMGVIIGSGVGGIDTFTECCNTLFTRGPARIHPLTVPKLICNIAAANVAIHFNAQGPCYPVVTACASGTDSLAVAYTNIKAGLADVMIAGGTETPVTALAMGSFCALQALSKKYNDTPQTASRPFDKSRDGFVIAEGAGVLILEELSHAKKRGAKIYAEMTGFGQSCDSYHLVAPEPGGRGAALAIRAALASSGLKPEDVDYINAHGTSTTLNDSMETHAIKETFGDHAYKLKVSSTKSMTGHMIGAGGGVEAIFSVLAIKNQFFPPTINYNEKDPECDLDYVPNKGVSGKLRVALSNSFGFGGHNAVVAFKNYEA